MYICIYVYIYIYVYIHVYIYIHTYIHICLVAAGYLRSISALSSGEPEKCSAELGGSLSVDVRLPDLLPDILPFY